MATTTESSNLNTNLGTSTTGLAPSSSTSNLGATSSSTNIGTQTGGIPSGQGMTSMGGQQFRSQGMGQDEFSVDRERGMMPPKEKVLYEQREFPPVVQETVLPKERKELQHVIHREVIIPEVHRITQPYWEKTICPEVIQNRELPPTYHEAKGQQMPIPPREVPQSSVQHQPIETQTVEKAPIVIETVRKVVTTEIQPVIYREVVEPVVLREMRPMHERFVEPPQQQNIQQGQLPGMFQPAHPAHMMHHQHQHPFFTGPGQQQAGGMIYPMPLQQSGGFPWQQGGGFFPGHQHQHYPGFSQQQQQFPLQQQQQQLPQQQPWSSGFQGQGQGQGQGPWQQGQQFSGNRF